MDSEDSPQQFLKLLNNIPTPAFKPKNCTPRANTDSQPEGSSREKSKDQIFEDALSRLLLRSDRLSRQHGPAATIDISASEFYNIMNFSKVPDFLDPISSLLKESLEATRELYDVRFCRVCRGYKVVLKETGAQFLGGRRILLCGGCGSNRQVEGIDDIKVYLRGGDCRRTCYCGP